MAATFRSELGALINKYSQEHGSNTPDFVLVDYLCNCLRAYDSAVNARERFYDRDPGTRAHLAPAGMELAAPLMLAPLASEPPRSRGSFR